MGVGAIDDRYQFQPPHVKLWRRRHQLRVPYDFVRMTYYACVRGDWFNHSDPMVFRATTCWSLAQGYAHARMNWVHTLEEVMEEFGDGRPETPASSAERSTGGTSDDPA